MLGFTGARYSAAAWQRSAADVATRALRDVSFYREQCARSGTGLRVPEPVRSADLESRLWTLCPLSAPYSPNREPSLWTGDPADLAAVLRLAGCPSRAVLEQRSSWVPWTRLAVGGPRYAAVLAADAPGVDAERVAALDEPARRLAAHQDAVLVGDPATAARIGFTGTVVPRCSLAEAAGHTGGPAVVFDAHLGYFAARPASCAAWHVSWRRFHAEVTDGAVLVTALHRRRPTLVRVIPEDSAFTAVGECAEHGTPILTL